MTDSPNTVSIPRGSTLGADARHEWPTNWPIERIHSIAYGPKHVAILDRDLIPFASGLARERDVSERPIVSLLFDREEQRLLVREKSGAKFRFLTMVRIARDNQELLVDSEHVYFTDWGDGQDLIRRVPLEGGKVKTVGQLLGSIGKMIDVGPSLKTVAEWRSRLS